MSGSRIGMFALALLVAAALCAATIVGEAGAAKLVGKDGRVYACYKAKGKHKGAVRLVAKKGKCHKGEKKVSWSVAGPAGEKGSNGKAVARAEAGRAAKKARAANEGRPAKKAPPAPRAWKNRSSR